MEALGRAATGFQLVQFQGTVSNSTSASAPTTMDCCTIRSRLGLAGSSLQPRRSCRRNSGVSSVCPSPAASLSFHPHSKTGPRVYSNPRPSSILEEENLFSTIHADDLEANASALVAECSDMDWRSLVDELRSKAVHSVDSLGPKALCLRALDEEMRSWIHDSMVRDIEVPLEGGVDLGEEWNYRSAVEELRMQANQQAAQQLARSVDDSFDWEAEVAELHRRVFRFGGAESPEAMDSEHRLMHAWFRAEGEELDTSTRMMQEAVSSAAVSEPHDWNVLTRGEAKTKVSNNPKVGGAEESEKNSKDAFSLDRSWFGIGAALAGAGFGAVEAGSAMEAVGSDPGVISIQPSAESIEAATRAPSWLAPAVLAFPVVSYFAFSYYRERVNPTARITDWMFSVVALVIVANIVLMATIGDRSLPAAFFE
ncbi:hypothetical protein R1sor_005812 [Riccia sorocarpa]|uniref:Uncharacterized protein n=1 Tax=Riccia sorocarpa TaxID=122646 RepID=A0ABD3HMN9_9MARC